MSLGKMRRLMRSEKSIAMFHISKIIARILLNLPLIMKRTRFLPLFTAAVLSLCGVSCESTDTANAGQYPQDGGYNPYGTPQSQSNYQQYNAPTQPYGQPQAPPSYAQQQPKPPYGSQPPQQNYGQQPYQTYTPPQGYTPSPDYAPPSDYAPDPGSTRSKKSSGQSGGAYTVQQGDTLYRIALDHGTTVSRLKSTNGLTSDLIHPGQQLTLP